MDNVIHKEGLAVLVHCQGGVGRTNMTLMAYLMWASIHRSTEDCTDCTRTLLSAADAHACVESQRKVIMSVSQEQRLRGWWTHLNNNLGKYQSESGDDTDINDASVEAEVVHSSAVYPVIPWSSAQATTYRSVFKSLNFPPLIVLVGYPGSGKSTLSKTLSESLPSYFVRINRDEMRSKKGQVDEEFSKAMQANKRSSMTVNTVIIDCCNLTAAKRAEWIAAGHNCRAWCIFFEVSLDTCIDRVMHRRDHPTIPAGQYGVSILKYVSSALYV
jgi:atypical dual specificity phosphatase